MSTILLCGYGAIGKRTAEEYSKLGQLDIYDPYIIQPGIINSLEFLRDYYDFAFLAVPTPTVDGKCDTSIVENLIKELANKVGVVVIRSTVKVGFTKEIIRTYKNVVFCPEFYGTTQHQAKNDYLILGGERVFCNKVAQLYYKIKPGDFRIKFYYDPTVAEMIKYMENCWLATKVVFCNSFKEACDKSGIEYDDVREGWLMDNRINPDHTICYEGQPYYDSHCLNKDIPAFYNQFGDEFIQAVDEINFKRKRCI